MLVKFISWKAQNEITVADLKLYSVVKLVILFRRSTVILNFSGSQHLQMEMFT